MSIPRLVLDPRNEAELVTQAQRRVENASNGALNDFTPGSPLAALLEGQVFATAELLYYLNMLPEALALEVLRLSGTDRSPGTKARGTLVFLLQRPLSNPFVLPAGYRLTHNSRDYLLSEQLFIPASALQASVRVEAAGVGSEYNLPAYAISARNLALNFLESAYNDAPISGGTDQQSIAAFLAAAQRALRFRGVLVSASDYAQRARELLGEGANAIAVPGLNSSLVPDSLGHVHLFVLDADGEDPSLATRYDLEQTLRAEVVAGTNVWVSPPAREPVYVNQVVTVDAVSRAQADTIYNELVSRLDPAHFQLGATVRVRDLEFWARSLTGVVDTPLTAINSQAVNAIMPTPWTLPQLKGVVLDLVSANGSFKATYSYGELANEVIDGSTAE